MFFSTRINSGSMSPPDGLSSAVVAAVQSFSYPRCPSVPIGPGPGPRCGASTLSSEQEYSRTSAVSFDNVSSTQRSCERQPRPRYRTAVLRQYGDRQTRRRSDRSTSSKAKELPTTTQPRQCCAPAIITDSLHKYHGLTAQGSYTFGHALDVVSGKQLYLRYLGHAER
jgi:hypothetical protein